MLHTSNSCFLEGGQKYKDIFFRVRNLITAFFENATWCPISKLKGMIMVLNQSSELEPKNQKYRANHCKIKYIGIHLATVNGFSTELVLWH